MKCQNLPLPLPHPLSCVLDKNMDGGFNGNDSPQPQISHFTVEHALQWKTHLGVPRKRIAPLQSKFPHSCVCKGFIHSRERYTYFPAAEQADRSWEYIIAHRHIIQLQCKFGRESVKNIKIHIGHINNCPSKKKKSQIYN